MRELTFKEVIENIKEGEIYESKTKRISCEMGMISVTKLYKNKHGNQTITFDDIAKYKKVREAVTFDEVVKSGKKCRVEHDLIPDFPMESAYISLSFSNSVDEYLDGKCIALTNMLGILAFRISEKEIRTVLKEGKWYIE